MWTKIYGAIVGSMGVMMVVMGTHMFTVDATANNWWALLDIACWCLGVTAVYEGFGEFHRSAS